MLYVAKGKIFWLRKHYRFLNKRDMLKDKVLLGTNTVKLLDGFNYITHPINETLKQTNKMADVKSTLGKEALTAIAVQFKKVQEAKKVHAKELSLHNKMITKFPTKEKELYAEKLAKYVID